MVQRAGLTIILIPLVTYLFFSDLVILPSIQGVLLTASQGIVLYWSQYKPNLGRQEVKPKFYFLQIIIPNILAWGSLVAILSVSLYILLSPDFDVGLKYIGCFYFGIIFGLWFIRL